MKRDTLCHAICGLLMILALGAACMAIDPPTVSQWNADAASAILNSSSLTGAVEDWEIKQMVWPSAQELSAAQVSVSSEKKAECAEWLGRFMLPGYLPSDIDRHLIAMKGWGRIEPESEESRRADIFLVRYRVGDYVVQIHETPGDVLIIVADETKAQTPATDRKAFINNVASTFLKSSLMTPSALSLPEGGFSVDSTTSSGPQTEVLWGGTETYSGNESVFETKGLSDGRFVRLHIVKPTHSKLGFYDPYETRF